MWIEGERGRGRWERGDEETDLMVFTPPSHPLLSKVKSESFDSKREWQGDSDTLSDDLVA